MKYRRWVALALGGASFAAPFANGAIRLATWNSASTGSWTQASNWSSNPDVPNNGADQWTAFVTSPDDAVTLNAPITIDHYHHLEGTLTTTGNTLALNNTFNWSGGAIVGTGTINIAGVTTLDGGTKRISRVTINAGTLSTTQWLGGLIDQTDTEGGIFNNGGLFEDRTDDSWIWSSQQTPVLNNTGSYRKLAGTLGSLKEVEASFNNGGLVDVQVGDLWLSGGGESTGIFNVGAGGRLIFSDFAELFGGAGANTTQLMGTSVVFATAEVMFSNLFGNARSEIAGDFDAEVLTIDPGALGEVTFRSGSTLNTTITGDLSVRSGRLIINTLQTGGVTFGFIDLSGGQIEGSDEVIALDGMSWTAGTIRGATTQSFEVFDGLEISGENGKSLVKRAFYNVGSATSSGGDLSADSADLINSAGSTWEATGEMDFVDAAGAFTSRFFNDGTFIKSTDFTRTSFSGVEFNNTGTVIITAGALSLGGGGISGGTFQISAIGELRFDGSLQHLLLPAARISGPIGSRLVFGDTSQTSSAATINVDVLELRESASFSSSGQISAAVSVLAPAAGDDVTAQVTGGTWTAGSFFQCGALGFANLQITGGGVVSGAIVDVGVGTSSNGVVSVNGASSRLDSASFLRIADFGSGGVSAGGGAVIDVDQQVVVGSEAGSHGSLSLNGAGTQFSGGAFAQIGRAGTGTADVTAGARAANNGVAFVGEVAGGSGALTIDGTGSRWDAEGQLGVGINGVGVVGITNGGVLAAKKGGSGTSTAVLIGRRGTGVGTISVSGAGAKLDAVDGHVVVGFGSLASGDTPGGRGNLLVFNGGAVHSVNGYVARNPGGIGSVSLFSGGRWDMDSTLFVGGNESGNGGVGRVFNTGGIVIAPTATRVLNNGAIFFSSGTFETGTLSLTGGGQMLMSGGAAGASTTLKTTAIEISTSTLSQLDLSDNRLIVDYTGATPIDSIRTLIQFGFNNGPWNGSGGILSSDAAAASTTPNKTGIGYVEAEDVFSSFPASFGGYTIDNSTLLARYTILGDANLDLSVDISDFSRVAANFNTSGPWFDGDFNYDGMTDIGDFALLASNFNKTLAAEVPGRSGAVPEPVALSILPIAACLLRNRLRTGRERRQRHQNS